MRMRSNFEPQVFFALLLAVGGCAPSPVYVQQGDGSGTTSTGSETTTTTTSTGTSTSGGTTVAGDDIQTLMADVVAPRICDQLRHTFIGLPGEGGHSGPEAGLDPTVGRWWIRDCTAHSHDGMLDLALGGTGWTWVDRESMGFRVQQYLRFDATASFTARMDIGYDHNAHIVTIWMRPITDDPTHAFATHVEPRGLVQAHATGAFSGVLGGLLSLGGSSADDRARQQVTTEGSQRLHDRFATGMTVTYAMATQQMDFMVGALERGQVPQRPYATEVGATWTVNQRLSVYPGGLDVLGPLDPIRGAESIEMELEEGGGVYIDAVCMADFERFYDTVLQGGTAGTPTGTRVLELTSPHQSHTATIPALGCPTLLLVTPHTDATLSSTGRVRVVPPPTTTTTTTSTTTSSSTTTTPSTTTTSSTTSVASTTTTTALMRPIRIHLTGLTVSTTSPTGAAWDRIGSEPDPYIVVASVPGQREIERTAVTTDRHEVALDHWLPGAYHAEDLPIRFSVYDSDVTTDELIGVVDATAAQVGAAGDYALELRSQGDIPRTMGSLRITVALVQ